MPRKKKELTAMTETESQNPNPNPPKEESDSGSADDVIVNVESHEPTPVKSKFSDAIASMADSVGLFDDTLPTEEKKDGRGRPKGSTKESKTQQGKSDLNSLAIALITLVLSLSKIPQNVKPNDSEVAIFSNHLTGIMLRHIPAAGKMSADAMDIIGMVAVLSAWYARVQPELKAQQAQQIESQQARPPQTPTRRIPDKEVILDPVSRNSPAAEEWLRNAASKGSPA